MPVVLGSYRTGNTSNDLSNFDPATYTCGNDEQANALMTRAEYRKPWVLPKVNEV